MQARKIEASDNMRHVLEGLIRDGHIPRMDAAYLRSKGYSDAEIIADRARKKLSGATIEKPKRRPRYEAGDGPTQERLDKGRGYIARTDARTYRMRSVMDIHHDKFQMSHRTAFQAFVQDAELHQRVRVADFNSNGGGSGGRLGGLGNVPDEIRNRHTRHEWVVARLSAMERQVCDALVFHCITKRDGTPFSTEEYGALIFKTMSDRSFLRGAAVMSFMHLVDRLVELYHAPDCPRIRGNGKFVELEK